MPVEIDIRHRDTETQRKAHHDLPEEHLNSHNTRKPERMHTFILTIWVSYILNVFLRASVPPWLNLDLS